VPHIIEIWTMAGEGRSTYTAACLSCGWVGGRGTRLEAEAEGQLHEEGEEATPRISLRDGSASRHRPGRP
jgi:hypothetical protein